jgi:hypothetical protein
LVVGGIAAGTLRASSRCARMSSQQVQSRYSADTPALDAVQERHVPLPVSVTAILLTALTLVAPMAHLFELPNKIAMPESEYFTVQSIYAGWWMVGLFLPAAFVANLVLARATREDTAAFWLAIGAAGLIALNLLIFMLWTQPANVATANWTTRPETWRSLRTQWEYSHTVNAGVIFLALCATTVSALRAR